MSQSNLFIVRLYSKDYKNLEKPKERMLSMLQEIDNQTIKEFSDTNGYNIKFTFWDVYHNVFTSFLEEEIKRLKRYGDKVKIATYVECTDLSSEVYDEENVLDMKNKYILNVAEEVDDDFIRKYQFYNDLFKYCNNNQHIVELKKYVK